MAALVFKVGALAIKTLAKPLANRFQSWVLAHPTPRQYVISAAQAMHRLEVQVTRSAEGKSGRAFVGNMTEEKSLELASKLASEGFIFAFGALIIAAEYERQRRNDVKKKALADEEKQQLIQRAEQERERLCKENQEQQEKIQWLMHRIDVVEQMLHSARTTPAPAPPQRSWGGFFGPRGLGQQKG